MVDSSSWVDVAAEAERIVRELGGIWKPHRARGSCWCPCHEPDGAAGGHKSRSLDVAYDGDHVLVICRAGCTQDVVIMELRRLGFRLKNGRARPGKSLPRRAPTPTPDTSRAHRILVGEYEFEYLERAPDSPASSFASDA